MSYGSLAAIPIDNGLVWVRPFYVTSTQTDLPSLRFVIVNFEGTVSIKPTLIEALADVFDQDLPTGEEPPPDPGEEPSPNPRARSTSRSPRSSPRPLTSSTRPTQALRDGDLAGYEELSDQATAIWSSRPSADRESSSAREEPTTTTTTTEPTSA